MAWDEEDEMQQSLNESLNEEGDQPKEVLQQGTTTDCIDDNPSKQRKFLAFVSMAIVFTTGIQLLLQLLCQYKIIDKTQFYNFYQDSAISIVFYVIMSLMIIASIVLSKLFRLNSFLIAFLFIFPWSFLNGMFFTFAIDTVGELWEDLLISYEAILYWVFFVQFFYMISVLIFKTYYNILVGLGLNLLFYLPITFFNLQFFPGFMSNFSNFDWLIDLGIFIVLHLYYFFQTRIVTGKRRFYYSEHYWGNGLVDYYTDLFWIFWYNLFVYAPPQQLIDRQKELRVAEDKESFQGAREKEKDESDLY